MKVREQGLSRSLPHHLTSSICDNKMLRGLLCTALGPYELPCESSDGFRAPPEDLVNPWCPLRLVHPQPRRRRVPLKSCQGTKVSFWFPPLRTINTHISKIFLVWNMNIRLERTRFFVTSHTFKIDQISGASVILIETKCLRKFNSWLSWVPICSYPTNSEHFHRTSRQGP